MSKEDFPYKKYRGTYQVLGGTTLVIIGVWLGSILVGSETSIFEGNALSYWTNILTEVLGVIVTIAVINQFSIVRERNRLKKQLVRQAGSPSQAIATEAVAQLRDEGWLTGENGLLKGAKLRGANLSGADLSGANLQGTYLYQANLSHAILEEADLREADLRSCKLRNARMAYADCSEATFDNADMSDSIPWEVNFSGASLANTNLRNINSPNSNFTRTNLEKANFSGSNLKNCKFIQSNMAGANFDGCTMAHAKIEQSTTTSLIITQPDGIIHLTVLPDGRAILPTSAEGILSQSTKESGLNFPYDAFVDAKNVNFDQYTQPLHPDYKNWNWERRRNNTD